MGRWLVPANELRRDWPHYFDHASTTLYVRSEAQFFQFRSITDGVSFSDGVPCEWTVTATSVPVGVTLLDDPVQYSLTLPIPPAMSPPIVTIPASFLDYLHQLPLLSDRLLFVELEILVSPDELVATLDATVISRTPALPTGVLA
jgi:hypothetical protein